MDWAPALLKAAALLARYLSKVAAASFAAASSLASPLARSSEASRRACAASALNAANNDPSAARRSTSARNASAAAAQIAAALARCAVNLTQAMTAEIQEVEGLEDIVIEGLVVEAPFPARGLLVVRTLGRAAPRLQPGSSIAVVAPRGRVLVRALAPDRIAAGRRVVFHCHLSSERAPFCARRFLARASCLLDDDDDDDASVATSAPLRVDVLRGGWAEWEEQGFGRDDDAAVAAVPPPAPAMTAVPPPPPPAADDDEVLTLPDDDVADDLAGFECYKRARLEDAAAARGGEGASGERERARPPLGVRFRA